MKTYIESQIFLKTRNTRALSIKVNFTKGNERRKISLQNYKLIKKIWKKFESKLKENEIIKFLVSFILQL